MLEKDLIENMTSNTSNEKIKELEKKIVRLERDKKLLIIENKSLIQKTNNKNNSVLETIEEYLNQRIKRLKNNDTRLELERLLSAIKEERGLYSEDQRRS